MKKTTQTRNGLKPILFSSEMVNAILDGRKTQTRRILKVKGCKPFIPDDGFDIETIMRWNKNYFPYGEIGTILWVRETWAIFNDPPKNYLYRANDHIVYGGIKWKPSIFMPFDACRLFLKVTNIRVERLCAITEDDCIEEGIAFIEDEKTFGYKLYGNHSIPDILGRKAITGTAFESYQTLWESINGKNSFDKNPFVWVIEFDRCEKPQLNP